MKAVKLTNTNGITESRIKLVEGVTYVSNGTGDSKILGRFRTYEHPLLARFFMQLHRSNDTSLAWEIETKGKTNSVTQEQTWCSSLIPIKRIELPLITTEQRVGIAINCALEVFKDEQWRTWAYRWLSGADRSYTTAKEWSDVLSGKVDNTNRRSAEFATDAAASAAKAKEVTNFTELGIYTSDVKIETACSAVCAMANEENLDVDLLNIIKKTQQDMI